MWIECFHYLLRGVPTHPEENGNISWGQCLHVDQLVYVTVQRERGNKIFMTVWLLIFAMLAVYPVLPGTHLLPLTHFRWTGYGQQKGVVCVCACTVCVCVCACAYSCVQNRNAHGAMGITRCVIYHVRWVSIADNLRKIASVCFS